MRKLSFQPITMAEGWNSWTHTAVMVDLPCNRGMRSQSISKGDTFPPPRLFGVSCVTHYITTPRNHPSRDGWWVWVGREEIPVVYLSGVEPTFCGGFGWDVKKYPLSVWCRADGLWWVSDVKDYPVDSGAEPTVIRLPVHLPGEQFITFDERDDLQDIVDRVEDTMLTQWLAYNAVCCSGTLCGADRHEKIFSRL